jgi:hypothetical protein
VTRRARRALGTLAVAFVVGGGAGCSIRQDAAGTTRVGVGLWGFGDPPGVDWNLDWPRREVPDLPAGPRNDLPPRPVDTGQRIPGRGPPATPLPPSAPPAGDARR